MVDFILKTRFNNPRLPVIPIPGDADDFNRTDATSLGSTSLRNRPYQLLQVGTTTLASPKIVANAAVVQAGGNGYALDETYGTLGVFEFVVRDPGTQAAGVAFAMSTANTGIRLSLRVSGSDLRPRLEFVEAGTVKYGHNMPAGTTVAAGDRFTITYAPGTFAVTKNSTALVPTTAIPASVTTLPAGTLAGLYLNGTGAGVAIDSWSFTPAS